jgi:hypothetical protein
MINMPEITDEEEEKLKRTLKCLDEASKLTDEDIDAMEEISREIGQMTADDYLKPFDI